MGTSLHDWLDEWLETLERPSEATLTVYRRGVRQFLSWLASEHPGVTTEGDLTRLHVVGWLRSLRDAGRSDATCRVRVITVRKWLGYVAAEDSDLPTNPAADLELPTPQPPPVAVISDADLSRLLKSMSGAGFVDRRDTAIVRLLWDTGIRRGELVAINLSDVDFTRREVLVHGKGGKDRIVPISGRTNVALRRYVRARSHHPGSESVPLFLSARMCVGGGYRMTGGALADMLKRRGQPLGLELHPHMLRHTWAADLKSQGIPDDYLERLAGWSTPIMSRRYGNAVADQQAREAARRLARGDRL